MIEKTLIRQIVYWIFAIAFLIWTVGVFGSQIDSCRDTVNSVESRPAQPSSTKAKPDFLQHIGYTVFTNFDKIERNSIETAKGVFIYRDGTGGVQQDSTLQQMFNIRLNSATASQISFFVVPNQESEKAVVSFLNNTQASARLIHWSRIENKNKNQTFVNHFQRALEHEAHTVFVIVKSDFEEVLSFLDSSAYSRIIEHTNGVYLPSVQLLSKKDQAEIFNFVENVQKSSFVFGVFFKKTKPTPEKKMKEPRFYVHISPNQRVVSTKPYYSYAEILQLIRDHEVSNWTAYHILRTQGNLPKALPMKPEFHYKGEWGGENQFFGRKERYTYEEARQVMIDHNINSLAGYRKLRLSGILSKILPASPQRDYGREWDYHEFFRKPRKPLEMQYQ